MNIARKLGDGTLDLTDVFPEQPPMEYLHIIVDCAWDSFFVFSLIRDSPTFYFFSHLRSFLWLFLLTVPFSSLFPFTSDASLLLLLVILFQLLKKIPLVSSRYSLGTSHIAMTHFIHRYQ